MTETSGEFGQRIDDNNREVALEKLSFVMDELVKTERDYVRDLALIVNDYIEIIRDPIAANCGIPVPEDLMRHDVQNIIFSNIEEIYEWHKNLFLNEVERCFSNPLEISYILKKNESKFCKMYTIYCQKNQMFDSSMDEHRLYFEELRKFSCHIYPLRDFLIRPVKRIMTYTLLLRKMLDYSKCSGDEDEVEEIQHAVVVMERLINNIDQMMVVDRLRDFNGNITAQGKLLLHGALRCVENPESGSKLRKNAYNDLYVFLFEQSVIFTVKKVKKKKYTSPFYVYKTHISTDKMMIEDSSTDFLSDNPTNDLFIIKSIDLNSQSSCFVCQVDSSELRSEWLKNLRDLIQEEHHCHLNVTTSTV